MRHPLGIAAQAHAYRETLEQRLLGHVTFRSEEGSLDDQDQHLILDCLTMRLCLIHDLIDRPTYSDGIPEGSLLSTWKRTTLGLKSLDVELYNQDWKAIREALVSPTIRSWFGSKPGTEERTACQSAFKRLLTGKVHYKWILNSAMYFVENGGEDWFELLNQWVVFDARVNLRSLDLTTACCTDYLDFEDHLPDSDDWIERMTSMYPVRDNALREYLINHGRLVAKQLFGDFCLTDYAFRPSHGKGATAEVQGDELGWWHKNRHFEVDEELITYLKYRLRENEWRNALYVPYRGVPRISELRCVPKGMTSNRTISMEPTTLQFLQKDVALALDEYFSSRPDIPIDLHDQGRSRRLCLLGSATGSYATIDLSSASDSVTTGLVSALFDGLPVLYPLLALRSTHTHVQDNAKTIDLWLPLKKYAPMGSSLCFPVECMIFTVACEMAVQRCTGHKSRKYDFQVYGDDIVIRTEYVEELIDILVRFGFIVNESKSFTDVPPKDKEGQYGIFREACGVEAINGKEITPLRLSRRLVSPSDNQSDSLAGLGVGLVDLVNRAYLYKFWTLRRWLNDVLQRHAWYRTCLRIEEDDYQSFSLAVAAGKTPWVPLAVPFVITPVLSATQWKCYGAQSSAQSPCQSMRAKVTVAVAKDNELLRSGNRKQLSKKMGRWLAGRRLPRLKRVHLVYFNGPDDFKTKSVVTARFDTSLHDDNDYFSWWVKVGRQSSEDPLLEVDATGLVTIRSRDLVWSQQWVDVLRPAHPSFSPCPGDRKGRFR